MKKILIYVPSISFPAIQANKRSGKICLANVMMAYDRKKRCGKLTFFAVITIHKPIVLGETDRCRFFDVKIRFSRFRLV